MQLKSLFIGVLGVFSIFVAVALADDSPEEIPVYAWKATDPKPPASWTGHAECAKDGKTYGVDYSRIKPGGRVIAIDAKTHAVLWGSPLKALGPVSHSAYRTAIIIEADEKYVIIYGFETNRRYIEVKDVATGQTLQVSQLLPTPDLVAQRMHPAPTTAPSRTWQWDERLVDQPMTIGARRYATGISTGKFPHLVVTASDVKNGEPLWKVPLIGFGPGVKPADAHFNLRMIDDHLLLYGTEPRGWFIQVIDPESGSQPVIFQYWRKETASVEDKK